MKKKRPKHILSLAEVAGIFFIAAFLTSLLVPAINQAESSGGTQEEMIFPEFPPFDPSNDWPKWARIGFVPLSGFIAALAGALCFWLFRLLLPKKFKPYFPVSIPKFDD